MKQHLQIALDHEPLAWINGVVYSNRPAWYNVTARALHMDLIVPKERPHHAPQPAVLFLCGGAYMVMDRSIWLPELMTLARAGYTVASMEYRTSNEAAFPAALEDVKTAIRFLRAHAEEYCVDPARIFLMGESAGGTLACLGGVTAGIAEFDRGDWPEQSSAVQGVVDFYGLTDLEHAPCVTGPGVLDRSRVSGRVRARRSRGARQRHPVYQPQHAAVFHRPRQRRPTGSHRAERAVLRAADPERCGRRILHSRRRQPRHRRILSIQHHGSCDCLSRPDLPFLTSRAVRI